MPSPIEIPPSQTSHIGFPINKQNSRQLPLSQSQVVTIDTIYYINDYANGFALIAFHNRTEYQHGHLNEQRQTHQHYKI